MHDLDDGGPRWRTEIECCHYWQSQCESLGNTNYPQIAEDYEKSFALLLNLPVDLFLGAHGSYFGLKRKYETIKADGPNSFIDPAGYKAYVTERRDAFRKEWERQKQHPGSPAP